MNRRTVTVTLELDGRVLDGLMAPQEYPGATYGAAEVLVNVVAGAPRGVPVERTVPQGWRGLVRLREVSTRYHDEDDD